jgi:heterodisulfide reductase subunit B
MSDARTEVAYFPGCSLHSSSELYDVQCKSVLAKLDIALREIADWNCCGATSAAKVNDFLALALPARNLGIADATGLAEIMIPCSSCYSRMLVAKERLAADPALAADINTGLGAKVTGAIKVSSILEVLLPKVRSGEIARKAVKKLAGLKPACYYGCLLTRFPSAVPVPDDVENPQGMDVLCRALGAEPVEWNGKTDCCGASATVNDTGHALLLMSRLIEDAAARGANCFVTTCPMCQLNLDAYQEQVRAKHGITRRLPIYLITELLGVALGMNPAELQIDRHLEESVALLKELRLA